MNFIEWLNILELVWIKWIIVIGELNIILVI